MKVRKHGKMFPLMNRKEHELLKGGMKAIEMKAGQEPVIEQRRKRIGFVVWGAIPNLAPAGNRLGGNRFTAYVFTANFHLSSTPFFAWLMSIHTSPSPSLGPTQLLSRENRLIIEKPSLYNNR